MKVEPQALENVGGPERTGTSNEPAIISCVPLVRSCSADELPISPYIHHERPQHGSGRSCIAALRVAKRARNGRYGFLS
ncbi:hypothetical protein MPTK2_1g16130 [Marchantia polymorpha subsp. ruderalis]